MRESDLYDNSGSDSSEIKQFRGGFSKYFLHGYTLSFVVFGFTFTIQFLIALSDLIIGAFGLIIALGILFISVGFLNSESAHRIWGITTQGYWLHQLSHGIVLSVLLGCVHLPYFLGFYYIEFSYSTLDILVTLFSFIFYSVIDGFIGKRVAEIFRIKAVDSSYMRTKSIKGRCPYCNADYFYTESSISKTGFVMCTNCSKRFKISETQNSSYPITD